MDLSELTAISPIDGRYRSKVESLAEWFSEYGLIKLRVKVELEYLKALAKELKIGIVPKVSELTVEDAKWIKNKEAEIKHDLKSVEYFLREKIKDKKLLNFIHFGTTTYDIDIPAYGLALKNANQTILVPELSKLVSKLKVLTKENAGLVMLARTHGQTAVPTTIGKEMANFLFRIEKPVLGLENWQFEGKLTGAVGNYNALVAAYPKIDWVKFSQKFVKNLGLKPNIHTTQILPYDNWLEYFSKLKLLNNILIGFCQDMWRYISDDYFLQIPKAGEVGSSTMPQKVNPIDFENAEGNLGIANSLIGFFESKLPISRLQRDLSDKTVKRNFGVALAHSLLAYQNILSGLGKITPNSKKMAEDLDNHWEVIAEGIQTILRAEGVPDAYEKLKDLTRGKKITKADYEKFIEEIEVPKEVKTRLLNLSPKTYIGLAKELANL